MDIRKTFATNKKKELEGVWVKGDGKAEFLIARFNNPNAEKLSAELKRPHRRRIIAGTLPEDIQRDIAYTVLANAVLLDWRGVEEDEKAIAFSPEAAMKYFKEMSDFADFIAGYSVETTLFQDREEEARRGN